MEVTEQLSFDHRDRKDVYEYVERHGSVREDEIRRALNLDATALGHHLAVLRREGYLRRDGDRIEVAYGDEPHERHEAGGETYTIRRATQLDLDGLLAVVREVAEEGTYIEAETVANALAHERVVLRHNELQSRMIFVATDEDDEVVGWVHLDLHEAEKLEHTAVLTVGLREEVRGRDVGSALLDRGVRWASDHGLEKLYNSIPATNERAIAWLAAHGWEREAVRESHYKIEGEYVDEVMMAVDLR
ncbi:MAG: GNAT family N-acetyltransferase [Haloferacaceae archaeon]